MEVKYIAIKTTAPSTEGLDIVDFICKVFDFSDNDIREIKDKLIKYDNKECFIIVFNLPPCEQWASYDMYLEILPDYRFQEISDKCVLFANFSDFKKYIEDTKEEKEEKEDLVNHPKHYTSHPSGVECIEITRHYCFSIGNAIKYLWRAGLKTEQGMQDKKKEIQDLEKAIWYIKDRINQITNARKIVRFTPAGSTEHQRGVKCENITQYYCAPIRMAMKFLWWCGLETNISFINPTIETGSLSKSILWIEDRINQLKGEK